MVLPAIPEAEYITHSTLNKVSGDADSNRDGISGRSSEKQSPDFTVEDVPDPADQGVDVDAAPSEEVKYPTGMRFWLLMFNLGAVVVLSALDMSIVATAVPRITDHFHTVADVGWYSVAFRLCQCAFQFMYGKAYKLFSIKRVFLLANAVSFLGSLLCGTAVSSTMLVVGRAIAGVGTAGLSAGAFIMLVQSVPLRTRPVIFGLWGAVEGLSTVAGPLIGGAITQSIGWRWCFYINLPIGGVTLLLTLICFSEAPKAREVVGLTFRERFLQLDLLSNFILIPALTCLFLAFSWAGTKYPWDSGRVVGLIVTFGVLAAAFVYNQFRRGDAAALPIRIVKRRTVIASFVFVTCLNSAGNVLEYYLPIYYQAVLGYNPGQSGLLMLPYLVGGTIGAVGAGVGTSACGYYAPFIIFAQVTMPIGAGLITTFKVGTGLAKLILYTGFFGLGYGVGSSGPMTAVQTVLADGDVPLGISVLMFGSAFGPAVTISIAQVIFANQLSGNLHHLIPDLNASSIDSTGITELVAKVPPSETHDVLLGIDNSIISTYYLVIALTGAMLVGTFLTEWRSVKKANPNRDPGSDSHRSSQQPNDGKSQRESVHA